MQTRVLRVKVDVVTRWNSIAAMLSRLVKLRIAVESWYAQHSNCLEEDDPRKLTDEQWDTLCDVLDIFTLFVPLTR